MKGIYQIAEYTPYLDYNDPSTYNVGYFESGKFDYKQVDQFIDTLTLKSGNTHVSIYVPEIPDKFTFPDSVVIKATYTAVNSHSYPYIESIKIVNPNYLLQGKEYDVMFSTRTDINYFLFRFYEKECTYDDFTNPSQVKRFAKIKAEELFYAKYDSDEEFKNFVKKQIAYRNKFIKKEG